jgi:hypothetical protein
VGEYVRLNGALIGRYEASGNWRITVALASADTFTLVPVSPDRRVLIPAEAPGEHYLVTVTAAELETARIGYDDELTLAWGRVDCPRCGAEAGDECSTPSGRTRRTPHAARGTVPPLQPPPPPLPVYVGEPRQRPSKVRVLESRNRNADLRITAADLAERRAVRDIDSGT